MEKEDFYTIYIPALEKAFQNDSINLGFYVKSPEDYLDDEAISQVDQYLKQYEDQFLERTACYFDAKSHGFPSIQGVDIDLYKSKLMDEMNVLKKEYSRSKMIISQLLILDWYDDIITSIISFENGEFYLLNCIQKHSIIEDKTYYCVKIDAATFKQIENITEKKNFTAGDWDMINLIFEKNNKNDHIFLLKIKSLLVGTDVVLDKAKNLDIIHIKFPFDISTLYMG